MFWILILSLLIVLVYYFMLKPLTEWRERNVPQKPLLELLQTTYGIFLKNKPFAEYVVQFYNDFPDKRYSGAYALGMKAIVLRDLELIKQITVKDFDHFTDHRQFIPTDIEPLWSNNLFALRGEKWRHMRSTLSPSFTSSKMKAMFVLMSQCAEDFVTYFVNNPKISEEVDLNDVVTRYANDVIATSAFGVKCDSLKDRNNQFYLMGKDATGIFKGTWAALKFTLFMMVPKISKLLGLRLFSEKVAVFFLDLVTSTIKMREEKNIIRPDMIHLLMEARKGKIKEDTSSLPDAGFATVEEHVKAADDKITELTDTDITAQALIFFFAGFETVSRSMCFILHEIGVNPDVQVKLQEEVDDTFASCNGKLTYEALTKMKYMDMVVSEGLRMWPNAVLLDRTCVKPYTIKAELPDEKPVHLNEGDVIWLPVYALQRDPKHYPDPDRFDPERFNEDNKKDINPYSFMTFGVGPRNCIGSRFALLEIKILLFHLLTKFDLVPTSKTQIPIKLNKIEFSLQAENGFYLGFKRRNLDVA